MDALRLLVVEDEPELIELARRLLSRHEVAVARDVVAAQLELADRRADVILLDLMLADGPAVSSIPELARLAPVVVWTAYPTWDLCVACVRRGAVGFVPKEPRMWAQLERRLVEAAQER